MRGRQFFLEVTLNVGQMDVDLARVRTRPAKPLFRQDTVGINGEMIRKVIAANRQLIVELFSDSSS